MGIVGTRRAASPSGPAWPISEQWKREIRQLMSAKDVSDAELARRVGVSRAAVGRLWMMETRQSRMVPLIHRALGLPAPAVSKERSAELAEILDGWRDLDGPAQDAVIAMIRQLARRK
jgi:transcriptional regulator with XRE-family HTH domain